MRKKPQELDYKDYAHVNMIVLIFTIIVATVIIAVLWIMLHYFVEYRRKKLIIQHNRNTDVQLERYINDAYQPLPYESNDEIANVIPFDSSNNNTISNSIVSIRRLREYRQPESLRDIRKDKYVKCSCRFTSCLSFIVVLLSFIIILIFPTTPEYHVCNSNNWNLVRINTWICTNKL